MLQPPCLQRSKNELFQSYLCGIYVHFKHFLKLQLFVKYPQQLFPEHILIISVTLHLISFLSQVCMACECCSHYGEYRFLRVVDALKAFFSWPASYSVSERLNGNMCVSLLSEKVQPESLQ